MGKPTHNAMLTVHRPLACTKIYAICSVPPLPTHTPLLVPGMPDFDAYAASWSRWISSASATALVPKPPIRSMFTAFKDFYTDLSTHVPRVTYVQGRDAYLHRARVARETENVEALRGLRNELIQYWYAYLEGEERKREAMNRRMGNMLDADVYPSHEWEQTPEARGSGGMQRAEVLVRQEMRAALQMQPPRRSEHIDLTSLRNEREDVGEPGPSTKRRRVDSGFCEMSGVEDERVDESAADEYAYAPSYVGKGKGRMGAPEVICID
jgi:hypothetical protein